MLKLYKKMGETPLECLERYRIDNPNYQDVKLTYAGRLDPMAEGELLVLEREECKDKEKYLGLDKEYEVDVLFGFSTDTYDILGLLNLGVAPPSFLDYGLPAGRQGLGEHQERVEGFLKGLIGKQVQKYPPFSSKTVGGKPLFELAKTGKLDEEKIPEREIEIYKADFIEDYWITGRDLKDDIFKRISLVKGDFRQKEILKMWEEVLKGRNPKPSEMVGQEEANFLVSKIKIKCSSGTYMRVIAQNLGVFLAKIFLQSKNVRPNISDKKCLRGVQSLALRIKRTKIFVEK